MRSRSLLVFRALAGAGAAPALFAGDNNSSENTHSSSFNRTSRSVFTNNHSRKNALCEAARDSVGRDDENFVSTVMSYPVFQWFCRMTETPFPHRLFFSSLTPSHSSPHAPGPLALTCPPSSSPSPPFQFTSVSLFHIYPPSACANASPSSSPPSSTYPSMRSAFVYPSSFSAATSPPTPPQSVSGPSPQPQPTFTTIRSPFFSSPPVPPSAPPSPPASAPVSSLLPPSHEASSPTNSPPSSVPPSCRSSSSSSSFFFPSSSSSSSSSSEAGPSWVLSSPPPSPPTPTSPLPSSPSPPSSPAPFPWTSLPRHFSRLAHWRNFFFLKSQSLSLRCGLSSPPPPSSSQQLQQQYYQSPEDSTGDSAISEQQRQESGRWRRSRRRRPRVVVVGSGWGAVSFLNSLDLRKYDVLLISPRNYFTFTPLLPAVSVGTLPDAACETAVRTLLFRGGKSLASFAEATVVDVNPQRRTVLCSATAARASPSLNSCPGQQQQQQQETGVFWEEEYDYLVLTAGAEVNTFNIPGVSVHSIFMKEAEDARKLRERLFDLLESAALPHRTAAEKRQLLHFVVVGGGPTGVEVAAELSDFLQEEGRKFYPALSPFFKVSLVEMLPKLLTMYSPEIQQFALENFRHKSIVDVRLQSVVTAVEADAVHLKTIAPVPALSVKKTTNVAATRSGTPSPNAVAATSNNGATSANSSVTATTAANGGVEKIPCGVVVWASGIKSPELCMKLKDKTTATGAGGRGPPVLLVNPQLRVKGTEDIFAFGDCSRIAPPRLIDYAEPLYATAVAAAQHEGDQYPSVDWVKKQALKLSAKFPQISPKSRAFAEIMEKFSEQPLTLETFTRLLTELDVLYVPPAPTAQNAKQQGEYLALVFNSFFSAEEKKTKAPAFLPHNKGALVYLGNGAAAVDFPPATAALAPLLALGSVTTSDSISSSESSSNSSTSKGHCWTGGLHTLLLWRMAYTSLQLTWGGATACVFGWLRTALEGRPLYREKLHLESCGSNAAAAPVVGASAVNGGVGAMKRGKSDSNDKQH